LIALVLPGALIGGLISLTALIPALRTEARGNPRFIKRYIMLSGLLSFLITYVVAVGIGVEFIMAFDIFASDSGQFAAQVEPHLDEARGELWLREANPFPGPACYTSPDACTWADLISSGGQNTHPNRNSEGLVVYVLMGLVGALTAWALARRFTRALMLDSAESASAG
jgi:hypothetical protein